MKCLLTIASLIIGTSTLHGQMLYKSSKGSYRTNYYLELKGDSVTLYAWEVIYATNDTIYFKASDRLDASVQGDIATTLVDYRFSKTFPAGSKMNYPLPANDQIIHPFLLYRQLHIRGRSGETMKVIMIKDVYDGKFDDFVFTRI